MLPDREITRRSLLGMTGLGLGGAVLAACSSGSGSGSGTRAATTGPSSSVPTTDASSGAASAGASAGASSSASSSASSGASSSAPSSSASTSKAASGKPLRVWLYQADGATYGVGMPIIAYFAEKITDASAFADATTVTVNGKKVDGAWNFRPSSIYAGYPLEAHYRTDEFWPAHARITLDLPIKDLSAGKGFRFQSDLSLVMKTGARNITRVDGKTLRLFASSDGVKKFNFPVSLGAADTPTYDGTKIVMARNRVERMVNNEPGDVYDLQVPWSVRLTNSGEFIHSASWNTGNIGSRSTSHGCTNLDVNDAERYFRFARVGDVTIYTNTGGRTMPTWDGYGDWNMPWAQWRTGGAVKIS